MTSYGMCWTLVGGGLGTAGVAAGTASLPGDVLVSVCAVSFTVTACGASTVLDRRPGARPGALLGPVLAGCVGTAGTVALVGRWHLLGADAVVQVPPGIAVTSPYVLHRLNGQAGPGAPHTRTPLPGEPGRSGPPAGPPSSSVVSFGVEVPDAAALRAVHTSDLCRGMETQPRPRHRRTSPENVGVCAELRKSYLDELERRSPDGFARWLASGARTGGDPGRYLRARPGSDGDRPTRAPAPDRSSGSSGRGLGSCPDAFTAGSRTPPGRCRRSRLRR